MEARWRTQIVNPDLVTNSAKLTAVTGVSTQKSNLAKKSCDNKLLTCSDHSFISKKSEEAKKGTCTLVPLMRK